MDIKFFEGLADKGVLDTGTVERMKSDARPLSVRRELLILLYFGVLLLSTGLGILIYEHIDTIGHLSIVLFVAAITSTCLAYCFRKANKPSFQKVESPNVWFDYILLLGCLTLLVFVGYVQFKYQLFGTQWGLASFVPLVLLAFFAYYFDHLGVLSLAIVNLGAWMGITVNLLELSRISVFDSEPLIYSGLLMATLLLALSYFSERKDIKAHFSFSYRNFGIHIMFLSLLSGMFWYTHWYLAWALFVSLFAGYVFVNARRNASFYFLLVAVLYFYIAISTVFVRLVFDTGGILNGRGGLYLVLLYFIASATGLVVFLVNMNKKLKAHDSL
ncbi:MAG: DUF2157 domain-containing protein [Flavipsychrobacter sp.]|nr:DUF2157 domain-containing protein [Flavipsychrobacter sp.]